VHDTPNWYGDNYTSEHLELTNHVDNLVEIAAAYQLTTGFLHHFNTRIKHTIINLSKKARMTLAFDIVVNKAFQNLEMAGQIFGDSKGGHRRKESERQRNVMLNAASAMYDQYGVLGTMVIDHNRASSTSTPTSTTTSTTTSTNILVVDLSVSFLNTHLYDTYKIYCGSTVKAMNEQLVDGVCRVELYFDNYLVVARNQIETMKIRLDSVKMMEIRSVHNKKQLKKSEYTLQGRVVNQKGQVLMQSESVVIVW
jgi:hypothetical protein